MATLGSFQRYHVIRGYTDMRKGIDGLAAIAILEYGQQLDDESIFLLCGRRADRLKGLYWDGTSYNLLNKRLPEGRFHWPRTPLGLTTMSYEEYLTEIEGHQPGEEIPYWKLPPYDLF